jgi:TIR domain
MADIFISYATADRPFARRLADALEARGWSVWWDHRSLHGGQHFDRIIEEAISDARVVIVVWSETSIASGWVRDEAMLALEQGKLVPLRTDMTRLPMRFRNIHTIDLSSWTGETEVEPFARLVKDLSHYLGQPKFSDTSRSPSSPAAPNPRTAVPIGEENQHPAETEPIAEHLHNYPSIDGSLSSNAAAQTDLITKIGFRIDRKNVGKLFGIIAISGGILWGLLILGERQQAPTGVPMETTVSKSTAPNHRIRYQRVTLHRQPMTVAKMRLL